MLRRALLGWLFFFAVDGAQAAASVPLETNYLVKAWTPGEGLPQSSINAMAQTPDGYLWLGTFNGLARFDGVRFVVFNPVNTPALRSARIVALSVDRHGWLWIVSEEGFLTRAVNGQLENMNGTWGLPPGRVAARGIDPGGNLWLGIGADFAEELALREEKFAAGAIRELRPAELAEVVPSDRLVWIRRAGAAQGIWEKVSYLSFAAGIEKAFGAQGKVLCVPSRDGDAWVITPDAVGKLRNGEWQRLPEGVSISEPTDAAEDLAGNLLIGTWTQGLLIYTPDGRLRSIPLDGGASARAVRVVRIDREGNPWVGTDLAGLQRLQPQTFRTYLGAETGRSGVVRSITEDRTGRIWCATPEGLDIVSANGELTKSLAHLGNTDELWWSLTADKEGQIWAGSMGDSFYRFVDSSPAKLFALTSDKTGQIWAGSTGDSSYRFGDTSPAKLFAVKYVRVVAPAREAGVWIGTEYGIVRLNQEALREEPIPAGMTNQSVRAIVEQEGKLWAGVMGSGVWCRESTGWQQFGTEQGLRDLRVTSLYADKEGTLWVGTTFGGLHRLKDGIVKNFTRAGVRLPSMVACITEDNLGFLWVGSLDGIYRVAKKDLHEFVEGTGRDLIVEKFDRNDGLQSTELSEGRQPTVLQAHDGRIWFATINGLSVVDPASVPQNPEPPRVMIEEISVNGLPVRPVAGGEVVIPPLSQRVTFQYTGISLKAGPRVRFKRRLVGLEKEWEDAGGERSATYYNLPPNAYRFEVMAANENGVWSTGAASQSIRALPAIWQAVWFHIATGLLLLGFVAGGIRLRLRALTQAQAEREAFSQQLIESQEQERRRISAELHDGLGQALLVVKHQARQAMNTPGAPPEAVERWSRVAQSTQTAIDEVRGIVSALRPAMLETIGLTGALSAMLQQTAESGQVKLTWRVPDMAGAIPQGHDIELFRVVQEALNNVLKHSNAANARVELRREPGRWILEIEDDGCGFDEAATLAGDARGGFGLRGMRERLRILGGTLLITAQPGAGCRLRAEAPIPE